jgi:hypothetical protein
MPVKQIGVNLGRKGLKDDEIVVLLRRLHDPTFITRDTGFYHPNLRHRGYCLIVAGVAQNEVAVFVRRLFRHPDFDTQAKRMGRVVRISHVGVVSWRLRSQTEMHNNWAEAM